MIKKSLNVIFLLVGIGFFLKMLLQYDLNTIWTGLTVVRYGFVWVLALWLLVSLLDTLTWKHTFGALKNDVPFMKLWLIMCAGQSINGVAPSGNLGELVKGKYLAEHIGGPDTISSLIIFNLMYTAACIVMIVLGAVLALFLPQVPGYLDALLLIAATVLVGAGILVMLVLKRGMASKFVVLIRRVGVPLKKPENWIASAKQADKNVRQFRTSFRKDFWIALTAQIVSRMAAVAEVYLICSLLQKPISLAMAFFVMSSSQLVAWIFSMIPGQIGVMEQGSDLVFGASGFQAGYGLLFELVRRARRIFQTAFGIVVLSFLGLLSPARKTKPLPLTQTVKT
jgi:uncharacterized protein (TIRG00374 family)